MRGVKKLKMFSSLIEWNISISKSSLMNNAFTKRYKSISKINNNIFIVGLNGSLIKKVFIIIKFVFKFS